MNKNVLITGIKNYQIEILLSIVVVLSIIFRFYTDTFHLIMVPDYDGYQYLKIAKNMTKFTLVNEAVNWTPLFPLLIAIFSFIPLPLDVIGSGINIIFGALTIIPIYLFVKNIFDKNVAYFSVLIYAFHPQIAFVNVQVMSETTYIFMMFMFAYIVSEVLKGKSTIRYGVFSGLFGGLIYLGRPEGTLIFILLTVLSFIYGSGKNRIKWFIANVFTFCLIIFPYALFLKQKVGKFVFSGKSSEILLHIRNMMGVPESAKSYLDVFFYDFEKTVTFIKNNIINAYLIIIESSYIYLTVCVILLISFFFMLKRSRLGLSITFILFLCMLTPVSAALIFKVDQRYLSPTTSVLSVIFGVGLYGLFYYIFSNNKYVLFKNIICLSSLIILASWGFYKIYERFEKQGELHIMFEQERLYKNTGQWLVKNTPPGSTLVSTSTNYLIAYYANDMNFENVSKNLSEEELIELVCNGKNRYLAVNDFSIRTCYKKLPFLINPFTQSFQTSKLNNKIMPIYYDDIARVVIYTCKDGTNK